MAKILLTRLPHVYDDEPETLPNAGALSATVFISYSRRDLAFVDRLDASLKSRGVETLVDRAAIEVGENWFVRLQDLITRAETVIFILSPDSIQSSVCAEEVAYGKKLGKRFIPVVHRRVDSLEVPQALSELNYVFLDDEVSYEAEVDRLIRAIRTDLSWMRTHADLGRLAEEWTKSGKPHGLLLGSARLSEAELWATRRPPNAPSPTEETLALLTSSRRAVRRWRNGLFGAFTAGLVIAVGLAIVALIQRQEAVAQSKAAEQQTELARLREGEANEQRAAAERQTQLAREAERRANAGQAASQANEALTLEDPYQAAVILTPTLRELGAFTWSQYPELASAAVRAAAALPLQSTIEGNFMAAALNSSGTHTALISEQGVQIFDTMTGQAVSRLLPLPANLNREQYFHISLSPSAEQMAIYNDATVTLFSVRSGITRSVSQPCSIESQLIGHIDDNTLIVMCGPEASIFSGKSGDRLASFQQGDDYAMTYGAPAIHAVAISRDKSRIATLRDVRNVKSGRVLFRMYDGPKREIGMASDSVRFSEDGRYLALQVGATSELWDVNNGRKLKALPKSLTPFFFADIRQPDGKIDKVVRYVQEGHVGQIYVADDTSTLNTPLDSLTPVKSHMEYQDSFPLAGARATIVRASIRDGGDRGNGVAVIDEDGKTVFRVFRGFDGDVFATAEESPSGVFLSADRSRVYIWSLAAMDHQGRSELDRMRQGRFETGYRFVNKIPGRWYARDRVFACDDQGHCLDERDAKTVILLGDKLRAVVVRGNIISVQDENNRLVDSINFDRSVDEELLRFDFSESSRCAGVHIGTNYDDRSYLWDTEKRRVENGALPNRFIGEWNFQKQDSRYRAVECGTGHRIILPEAVKSVSSTRSGQAVFCNPTSRPGVSHVEIRDKRTLERIFSVDALHRCAYDMSESDDDNVDIDLEAKKVIVSGEVFDQTTGLRIAPLDQNVGSAFFLPGTDFIVATIDILGFIYDKYQLRRLGPFDTNTRKEAILKMPDGRQSYNGYILPDLPSSIRKVTNAVAQEVSGRSTTR